MQIEDLIKQLKDEKEDLERARQVYEDYKLDVESTKQEIRAKLEELGMKSAKTDSGTAAIVSKPKINVVNEAQVINWLNENNLETDLYLRLDKRALEPVLKEWEKETGEIIPGTENQITEYLSVKESK